MERNLLKVTKYFIFLFFIIINSSIYAQLTFNDLYSLINKSNWESINIFLLNNGWEYYNSTKGDDNTSNQITWSFKKNSYDDKAEGWFYVNVVQNEPCRINYTFYDKTRFTAFQNSVDGLGINSIDSKIDDDKISFKYIYSNLYIDIVTNKTKHDYNSSITGYSIIILKKGSVLDSQNGLKKIITNDGNTEEYTLVNGKVEGNFKVYYPNGKLKKEGNLYNGIENGIFKYYNEDGFITKEVSYKNGKLNGVVNQYEDSEKIQIKIHYLDDSLDGTWEEFNKKGNLTFSGSYKFGKKNGLWNYYYYKADTQKVYQYINYSNDILDGDFKIIDGDSLQVGTYKDGLLNGPFKISFYQTLTNQDSSTEYSITSWDEGFYRNGLKTGKWMSYWFGNKTNEGYYDNNKKTGIWKRYVITMNYTGEVLSETSYLNDKKNGLCKKYFELIKIPDSTDLSGNSLKLVSIKINDEVNYKDDLENGMFTHRDSNNVLIAKGEYINGKQNGNWFIFFNDSNPSYGYLTFANDELNGQAIYKDNNNNIYLKGNFINGNKDGEWIRYYNGKISNKENYKNGKLDGTRIEYDINKNIIRYKKEFKSDNILSIHSYDSTGTNINHEINSISSINSNYIDFTEVKYIKDTTFYIGYRMKNIFDSGVVDHMFFDWYFNKAFKEGNVKKNGDYFELIGPRDTLEYGHYTDDNPNGIWIFNFLDLGIYSQSLKSQFEETPIV